MQINLFINNFTPKNNSVLNDFIICGSTESSWIGNDVIIKLTGDVAVYGYIITGDEGRLLAAERFGGNGPIIAVKDSTVNLTIPDEFINKLHNQNAFLANSLHQWD